MNWIDKSGSTPSHIRVRIRSEARGSQEPHTIDDAGSPQGQRDFELPMLPAGTYWIDAIAEGENGITGWAVEQITAITPQCISNVKLSRE